MSVLERLRELDSSERTFEAGERLFRVGDEVSVLHLVEHGEAHLVRLRAESFSPRTVRERLDAWIAWSGEGHPAKGTWKTVANEIGTSPEALYRELARRRSKATRA